MPVPQGAEPLQDRVRDLALGAVQTPSQVAESVAHQGAVAVGEQVGERLVLKSAVELAGDV